MLIVCAPLFWFTALRPLSDVAGSPGCWLRGRADRAWSMLAASRRRARPRVAIGGALLAGSPMGFRSQTVMLTVPLLLAALVCLGRAPRARRAAVGAALAIGVLVWAVPLSSRAAGLAATWRALGRRPARTSPAS